MKRRDFTVLLSGISGIALFHGCSKLGFSTGSGSSATQVEKTAPPKRDGEPTSRPSRRRSSSITDLKTLSKLLQQARCPLTDMQVEYLLTLKEGPEFTKKMMDVLDDTQKEAIKNASGGGRRRR